MPKRFQDANYFAQCQAEQTRYVAQNESAAFETFGLAIFDGGCGKPLQQLVGQIVS